jgi:hypothetical protein
MPAKQFGVDYGLPVHPCPEGQIGYGGTCIPDPFYTPSTPTPTVPTPTPTTPLPPTGCPEGQYGVPGACFPLPSTVPGTTPATPTCPGGQSWAPALNKCVPIPGGVDPTEPTAEQNCTAQGGRWNASTGVCEQVAQSSVSASWWSDRTTAEKGLMVGGAALAGFMLVSLLTGKDSYRPNLAPSVKKTSTGIPLVRGRRWGHASPPKRYRKLGATRPSDYAYPARFMYPIHDRQRVVAAKGYFAKHKRSYPKPIRDQIAGNINKAARRFGLAPDVKP